MKGGINPARIAGLLIILALLTVPRPAAAAVVPMSLEELTLQSTLILYGTVTAVESKLDPAEGIITLVHITVAGQIKGEAPGEQVTLWLPGGEVGGLGLFVADVPRFVVGERVLLFLEPAKGGDFRVTGWNQGKFILADGRAHNPYTGFSLPAVEFVQRILGVLADQATLANLPAGWQATLTELGAGPGPEPEDFVYEGKHWPGPNPMGEPYLVNVNTTDPGDMLAAIQAAAATWSSVPTADFVFTYGGLTSATDRSYSPNGKNEIVWKDEGGSGILATTYYWYSLSANEIFEADMVINDYYRWDTSGKPGAGEYDLQSVGLHEFGHYLSLGHDPDPQAVMYGYFGAGQVKRTLHANDIAGISYIYPVSATPTGTPTPTQTPTPTPTPTPAGTLAGRVILQGRTDHSGAVVAVGSEEVVTGVDGGFECTLPPGMYTVTISRSKYLTTQVLGVQVYAWQTTTLDDITLPGGDADGSGDVDIFDLVLVGVNFNTSPPSDPRADVNDDDWVNIYDLVLVGVNFGQNSPITLSAGQTVARQQVRTSAYVQVVARPAFVEPGDTSTVEVRVRGAVGAHGAEVHLALDPESLAVLDAWPEAPGVQGAPGDLLDPEATFVAQNVWDPSTGRLDYAASLLGPDSVARADGVLVRLAVRALREGTVELGVAEARLADGNARPIPLLVEPGMLRFGKAHRVYLPLGPAGTIDGHGGYRGPVLP